MQDNKERHSIRNGQQHCQLGLTDDQRSPFCCNNRYAVAKLSKLSNYLFKSRVQDKVPEGSILISADT